MVIDGYPVFAEFKQPTSKLANLTLDVDEKWYCTHVRESQYFLQVIICTVFNIFSSIKKDFCKDFLFILQISKCANIDCCGQHRSELRSILPTGFFPPPYLVEQDKETGFLVAAQGKTEDAKFLPLFQRLAFKTSDNTQFEGFTEMPYDFFCPTVQSQLDNRICSTCGLYFATKKAASAHMKALKHKLSAKEKKSKKLVSIEAQRKDEMLCIFQEENTGCKNSDWCFESEIEIEDVQNCVDRRNNTCETDSSIPVINSMEEWLQNPWSTD